MIPKSELKGKPVQFIDRDGKYRIARVYRISGRTLSVGIKKNRQRLFWQRIHPDKDTIHGVIIRKKLVSIDWKK